METLGGVLTRVGMFLAGIGVLIFMTKLGFGDMSGPATNPEAHILLFIMKYGIRLGAAGLAMIVAGAVLWILAPGPKGNARGGGYDTSLNYPHGRRAQ